ncbi:sensor histidine kinase [Polymorphospora rubra]|uniref:Histidine kinase n=1 Tax=Polymorphospora rubra TaxID=338584 RepID=A0A810N1B2_9ACTN|nr:histidine kinase [Polymorphospora rubra]BCJ67156.1 histidine kinase [Polymorphospora rubra]
MRSLTGWWRGRGQPERFDLYTRLSMYGVVCFEPLVVIAVLAPVRDAGRILPILVLSVAHAVVCLLLTRAGLDSYLGRRPRPVGLAVAAGVLTLAGTGLALLLLPTLEESPAKTAAFLVFAGYFYAALSTAVPPRVSLLALLAGVPCTFVVGRADDLTSQRAVGITIALVAVFVAGYVSFRLSAWMLGVVWQLDRSRQVQARLAVAEERLRFARDLHDVLGRNLSVVALKSELAAKFAERGRAEAVTEMLEVRRIAQESLTEVREVVRGYRSPDLEAELAGARSVLAAAGVDCRVLVDGTGLPPDAQATLGWVVREGTTNVLRHTDANECVISLRTDGRTTGTVTLTMENDGVPAGRAAEFGNGLQGLAERLAAVGGTVSAGPGAPGRFRLTARLPLDGAAVAP